MAIYKIFRNIILKNCTLQAANILHEALYVYNVSWDIGHILSVCRQLKIFIGSAYYIFFRNIIPILNISSIDVITILKQNVNSDW